MIGWVGVLLTPGWLVAQSCELDVSNECVENPVCQPDGSCSGTPRPDMTPCGTSNPCAMGGFCLSGQCLNIPDVNANGRPCTPSFGEGLGACLTSAACNFGTCVPQIKTCPEVDGNRCTIDVCNPTTGQCTVFNNTCDFPCATGQCNPGTGACTNVQPRNNGMSCDDFNDCTGNDRCTDGECIGNGGSVDPTRTPTVPNVATPTQTPTATEVPGEDCEGDCDANGTVSLSELTTGIAIALTQSSLSACVVLDADSNATVTIDELIRAVRAANLPCVG